MVFIGADRVTVFVIAGRVTVSVTVGPEHAATIDTKRITNPNDNK